MVRRSRILGSSGKSPINHRPHHLHLCDHVRRKPVGRSLRIPLLEFSRSFQTLIYRSLWNFRQTQSGLFSRFPPMSHPSLLCHRRSRLRLHVRRRSRKPSNRPPQSLQCRLLSPHNFLRPRRSLRGDSRPLQRPRTHRRLLLRLTRSSSLPLRRGHEPSPNRSPSTYRQRPRARFSVFRRKFLHVLRISQSLRPRSRRKSSENFHQNKSYRSALYLRSRRSGNLFVGFFVCFFRICKSSGLVR